MYPCFSLVDNPPNTKNQPKCGSFWSNSHYQYSPINSNSFVYHDIIVTKLWFKWPDSKGSHQKKTGKKLHNSCELWGGVSKFLCVNLKKCFFRANFPKKKHTEINS